MNDVVYLNGAFLPASEATISVYNGGWLHGAGLFETIRAERGRALCLDRHLDRLCTSSETLLAPLERSALPDNDVFTELLRRNDLEQSRIRLTVSAGDMLTAAPEGSPALTICVTAAELSPYPRELYASGMTVLISKYRQSPTDPLTGHKTIAYLPRLLALREARAAQCDEAIWFTQENMLAEGSISNIFLVRDGNIATPPIDTPVLPGVARGIVLECCSDANIPVNEAALTIDDLLDADEVFMTNVIMQVLPVCRVETRPISDGKPGPITRNLLGMVRQKMTEMGATNGQA